MVSKAFVDIQSIPNDTKCKFCNRKILGSISLDKICINVSADTTAVVYEIRSKGITGFICQDCISDIRNDISELHEITSSDENNLDISVLGFSSRIINSLERENIKTVGDLKALSYNQLLSIRNLGKRSIDEITEKLLYYTQVNDN